MNAENPYAPPRANVTDVAGSSDEPELAGRGIRLGAQLLDSLIASVFTVWLGIKVVRSDGSKASLGRIFWSRNVVNALLGILPFYAFIDPLVIFGEARHCVHDKIADTIVVVA